MRNSTIFKQTNDAGNTNGLPSRVHMRTGVLLCRCHSLQHKHQRAAGRADINGLVARVQHEDRTMQAFQMISDHAVWPPAVVENADVADFDVFGEVAVANEDAPRVSAESPSATLRSVRASASSVTRSAPARFSTRAQAAADAPVVRTSSTSRTFIPFSRTPRFIENAPRTLARRLAFVRPA